MTPAEQRPLAARLDRLNDLRDVLYSQPGCSCGGPLHILLDDSNVRDEDIVFCYRELHEERHAEVRAVGLAILHELMFLSPAQRLLWWECAELQVVFAAAGKNIEHDPDPNRGYRVKE